MIDQLRAVFRQPEIIVGTVKAVRSQDTDITEAAARDALQQIDPLWDEFFPAEQARIVQLLVERIDIGTEGLNVRLRQDNLAAHVVQYSTGVLKYPRAKSVLSQNLLAFGGLTLKLKASSLKGLKITFF